uniref:Pancreatic trypsin inhibitor n=1 Tax=Rhipicephalus zambeziensis TaxID=60191 RepID=A0A224YD38_9ACAR
MRLLQYPILACLLICMIAGDEGDENHPRPGSPRKPMPQNMRRGTPAGKRSPVAKNPGGHGGGPIMKIRIPVNPSIFLSVGTKAECF